MAPAPIPVRRVAVTERYAKEREVIESIEEGEAVMEMVEMTEAVVPIEAAKPTPETVIPIEAASAIEAAHGHAPARKHGAKMTAAHAHHGVAAHAAHHVAATTGTMAAEPAAAAERHGWRCPDDCRRHRARGKAPQLFGIHDSDPS